MKPYNYNLWRTDDINALHKNMVGYVLSNHKTY
jgi:hypothetical protein